MITLAPQFTQREYRWADFKAVKKNKFLILQFEEDLERYLIYGYDGPEVHLCYIHKGEVPLSVVESGYSQEQNDLDKTEFENTQKSLCNKQIITLSSVQSLPPIGAKIVTINGISKRLFARFTGIKADVVNGSNTISYSIPYPWVKVIGLEVINCSALDTADLRIYDSDSGAYTGTPNQLLNQYAYTLNMPKDYYIKTSQFDADVYQTMVLKFDYVSVGAKTIGINILMNEVMD